MAARRSRGLLSNSYSALMKSFIIKKLIGFSLFMLASLVVDGIACFAQDPGYRIESYRPTVNRIINEIQKDSTAWELLSYLCDTFGPRLSGSSNHAHAVEWIAKQFQTDGFENVHTEDIMVPHWVRGRESLELLEPRHRIMPMSGLGGSVATPPEGITAEALIVSSFDDLKKHGTDAKGKIVVFNVPWINYGETVQYRSRGAAEAARAGAVACLIRSVSPHSPQVPHTGVMGYADSIPKIPCAAISIEDAAMLLRMHNRDQKIVLVLKMDAAMHSDTLSHNVMAEIRGKEKPEEIVVMGGHLDSWDVGEGAQDDGSGCVAAWAALRVMKRLGLQPRRTIRVVFWTNEENGLRGGRGYLDHHLSEVENHILAIEADAGIFKPLGFGLTASDTAILFAKKLGPLLSSLAADTITKGGGGVDISPLMRAGVPGMGLHTEGSRYFWYHHSDTDTVDTIDPRDLNACVAAMAIISFVVADLPIRFPR
jgi:carboxypeptidase Q